MLSYTLLTVAVKCFMLIFYIFYFDCDKFGSEGSFFFQNERKQKYCIKGIYQGWVLSHKQRKPAFSPPSLCTWPSCAQQLQILALESGKWTGSLQQELIIPISSNISEVHRHRSPRYVMVVRWPSIIWIYKVDIYIHGGIISKCYLLNLGLCFSL